MHTRARQIWRDEHWRTMRAALEPLPESVRRRSAARSLPHSRSLCLWRCQLDRMRRERQALDASKRLLTHSIRQSPEAAACAWATVCVTIRIVRSEGVARRCRASRLSVAEGCLTAADTMEKEGKMGTGQSIYDASWAGAAEVSANRWLAARSLPRQQSVDLLVEQLSPPMTTSSSRLSMATSDSATHHGNPGPDSRNR